MRRRAFHSFSSVRVTVVFLTVVAAALRFTGLAWDNGARLHPDEALIVNGAMSVRFFGQLAPGFHDYNGFSVYILRLAALLAAGILRAPALVQTPEGMTMVGRALSALVSTASIPLIYLLAKRFRNAETGVLAAFFLTATPLLIQLAHFYTTESILVFLLLVLGVTATAYADKPGIGTAVYMAIPAGLLLATKNTSYLLLAIPSALILTQRMTLRSRIRQAAVWTSTTALLFVAASPYSFIDFSGYMTRFRYLSDVVSGKLLMDWTLQFQNTSAIFWARNLLYAYGPSVIAGSIAIISCLLLFKRQRRLYPGMAFALWAAGYFVFLSGTYLKFIRYSALLSPFIALFAAVFLWDVRTSLPGKLTGISLILLQSIWAIMFFHIYLVPHTSTAAAAWIAAHVPDRSVILREEWNSIIPFTTTPLSEKQFGFYTFNAYVPDSPDKMSALNTMLKSTQIIVLESPKVKNTVTRLSGRYPETARFYTDLENGALGFEKVAVFTSYPALGPLTVNDSTAEETWSVFDHPAITVYARHGVCTPDAALHCQ